MLECDCLPSVVDEARHCGDSANVDSVEELEYRVFHFEVSISAPRLDLGSKSQQILAFARAGLIWDCQPLGAKARAVPFDFQTH
jgi:hypothetical protein